MYLGQSMNAIFDIPAIWHDIAADSPKSLNARSVNSFSYKTGIIGELAVSELLSCLDIENRRVDTYNYDFVVSGLKVDVKSNCNEQMPTEETHAGNTRFMLTKYLAKQECDLYVFTMISFDKNQVQVMGFCQKEFFWSNENGIDFKKGEMPMRTPLRQDARILAYKHLRDIYSLPRYLEKT